MYIRETKTENKKTGKVYVKHTLVESTRTPEGPRQRTVMQLGRLSLGRRHWPSLAIELERRIAGQTQFDRLGIEPTPSVLKAADSAMAGFHERDRRRATNADDTRQADFANIDLRTATSSFSRSMGPELVAHAMWERLGMPGILGELGFDGKACSLAEAVVAGRLIHPGSDLATWDWISGKSGIGELVKPILDNVGKNRVYEISDRLFGCRKVLERRLREVEQRAFPCEQRLFLFDLTNFHMEGQALGNSFAAHGKSKQKRYDCPLLSLALAVDSRGFPLFSKTYPGNVSEPATFQEILEGAGLLNVPQPRLVFATPTVIMDRGIAIAKNIALLQDNGIAYMTVERGPRNQAYLGEFTNAETDPSFTVIGAEAGQTIRVKKVAGELEGAVDVLCVSSGRRAKEKAIADRWEERAAEDVLALQRSIRAGNIRQRKKILRKIGRLDERYAGFGRRFTIELIPEDGKPERIAELTFTRKALVEQRPEDDNPLHGTYVIGTTHDDLDAERIWRMYMTLTRVEAAFRSIKSDLGTRPIYHQSRERSEAHLFVAVLAYHLLVNIEHRLREAGDNRRWGTVRDLLLTHRRDTLIFTDDQRRVHHIRQTGAPEPAHLDIYRKLAVGHRMERVHEVVARRL